jgi:GT2 family glycosyltransferase
MYGRDPDPTRPATSWRLHFGAALVRIGALRRLGGPDPGYATALGAALDMGHRYLWSGALVRFEPALAGPTGVETTALPLADEVRFLRRRYGDAWARWALGRAVVSGRCSFAAARRAWRTAGSAGQRPPPATLRPRAIRPDRSAIDGRGVSVLVPTLDRYDHLEALLRELPSQTVPTSEVVVIDQTPETRRRRLAVGPPVVWLVSDRQGQCSSRNLGIRRSTGDCLLFLDDDDADLPPDLIERHLANLAAFDAEVSCGVADEAGAGPLPVEFGLFRVADVLPTNNCMIRRRALERSGLFDLAYERGARADADLGMRLYLTGALALLDPRITVRHLRAPTGGLRAWGARRRTWAEGRRRLWRRHLPSVTELYLAHRYFSPAQVRERLWIAALSTLAGRGPTWRRAVTAGLGLVALPVTLAVLRRRRRAAERMLDRFPQIPLLEGRR